MSQFVTVDVIGKKRDKKELTTEEIKFVVDGFTSGAIADYQMSALLMAIVLNGMSNREIADLTQAMIASGIVADLSSISKPKVDKHSSGGVGDKVSLILAPMVCALGIVVPMMSGRGLGFTGGTLDKLESIPGFRTSMQLSEFVDVLKSVGVAIIATTSEFAPADKKIYALRDVSGTVGAIPLQCSSIMSKKIAENPDALVLDVKTGSGSYNPSRESAVALATAMVSAGEAAHKPTVAFVTSMDQPLGQACGNFLEIQETVRCLSGQGPEDLEELVVVQGAQMLILARLASSLKEGVEMCRKSLRDGSALAKWREMVRAQGGDDTWVADVASTVGRHVAKFTLAVRSPRDGVISAFSPACEIGMVAVALGAGRLLASDAVDPAAGVYMLHKIGSRVTKGTEIATLYSNISLEVCERAAQRLLDCVRFADSEEDVTVPQLIRCVVDKNGVTEWSGY